jgi:hypothetical protein
MTPPRALASQSALLVQNAVLGMIVGGRVLPIHFGSLGGYGEAAVVSMIRCGYGEQPCS